MRPGRALSVAATAVVAVLVVQSLSCSAHELIHALVGLALGWQVEAIDLCLLDGGAVTYSYSTGGIADDIESYAGGLVTAALLTVAYVAGLVRTRAPRRSPVWWTVGLVVAAFAGAQLLVGLLEGIAAPGENYGDRFRDSGAVYIPLAIGALLIGPVAHTVYWRKSRPAAVPSTEQQRAD